MANDPVSGFPAPLGAPPRFEAPEPEPEPLSAAPRSRVWLHFLLFALTLVSMQATAMALNQPPPERTWAGWAAYQALPLLGILVIHELGHYIAARLHGVPASLPFFVPFPFLSPFGTMGALITMDDRIRSRKALLDIGAAGPIAGMLVAVPVLCLGLAWSPVTPRSLSNYTQEGQSLLYWLLKRLVLGPIPDNHDVELHPMAFAGWGGLYLTMLNLLPWGQLDGGHIAYALLGKSQHRIATWVRRGLLVVFLYNAVIFVVPVLLGRSNQSLLMAIGASASWLVLYGITGWMARISGADHPPFDEGELDGRRRGVAVLCLVLFVLLFMPTPLATY